MEDRKVPSPSTTSPNTSSSSTTPSLPPLSPKPVPSTPNPNPHPHPTTFIQADTHSFKQVVQMLTGSAETTSKQQQQQQQAHRTNQQHHHHHHHAIPPINKPNKKPAFKLYERRPSMKNLKMISPLLPSFSAKPEILSPSILDFPSLVLSPVTPLSPDPFNRSPQLVMTPEDRAIADKGFYLHPSPRSTTPRDGEPPKLLPLFPLSSPRMEAAAAAELGL